MPCARWKRFKRVAYNLAQHVVMITKLVNRIHKSLAVSSDFISFIHLDLARLMGRDSQCGVHLRGAPGRKIFFRNNSTDYATLLDCFFSGFHRPNRPLPSNPVILDLGANAGYAMVDLYFRHPGSRIFGVELDSRNVQVAVRNIKGLGMDIINAAVFYKDGEIEYNTVSSFDAFKIGAGETSSSTQIKVQALSIGTILRKFDIRHVDYIKIDIEGAEKDLFLLGDLSWLDVVDQINVELHDSFEAKVLIKLLQDRGFKAKQSAYHWASVIGWRE